MKLTRCLVPLSVVALLAGCTRTESVPAAPAPLPPAKVRLATVRLEPVPAVIELTGTVRPLQHAVLAAKLMGTVTTAPVALGQAVRAGEVLITLSAGEITARLAQAQAQANVARRDLAREQDLLGRGASTADLVRGLEDRFALTQAMVREAEVMLGYATLTAPFDGVIARKLAQVGDLAAPGQPLLEVEGTGSFQIEVAVPDSIAAGLVPGATVAVAVTDRPATFTGPIAELAPTADVAARSVLAKVTVPAGVAVRSGQFLRVHVTGAPAPTLLAPAAAVARVGQLERVFVADEQQRAVLRLVKTGATRGDRVEILAGLDDRERVVLDAPAGLREGQPLEVLP